MSCTEDRIEIRLRFGLRLKQLRREQKLTQEQLGEIIGVSRTCVSRWESGRVSTTLDTLAMIAKGLGVSLSDLFYGIDPAKENSEEALPLSFGFGDRQVIRYEMLKLRLDEGNGEQNEDARKSS